MVEKAASWGLSTYSADHPMVTYSSTPSELGTVVKQLDAYKAWVYSAIRVIKDRETDIPLRLYVDRKSKGEVKKEEIKEHQFLDLWAQPCPIMTGQVFKNMIRINLELTGMAFCQIFSNGLGRPVELWPIPTNYLSRIITGDSNEDYIKAFEFNGSGKMITLPPEEVLYFRYPHPTSLVYGASPIQAQAHAYDVDLYHRIYQKQFFNNSARPDFALTTDQRVSEPDAKRILGRWLQRHQGPEKAHLPALLEMGLKPATLGASAKDFQFMELAKWTRDNVLATYGVPAGKLGLVEDVNRANAEGIDITFNSECIKPRLTGVSGVLNKDLTPRWDPKLYVEFDDPVPRDKQAEHQRKMDRLDRGVIAINELREADGLKPVDGGDVPTVAAGRVPLSQVGLQPKQPEPVPPKGGHRGGIVRGPSRALGSRGARSEIVVISSDWSPKDPKNAQKGPGQAVKVVTAGDTPGQRLEAIKQGADVWEPQLVSMIRDMEIETLANLNEIWPRLEGKCHGMSLAKVQAFITKANDFDDIIFDPDKWTGQATDTYNATHTSQIATRGANHLGDLGLDIGFNVTAPEAVAFMESRTLLLRSTIHTGDQSFYNGVRKVLAPTQAVQQRPQSGGA